jgi:hypothetical protein
LARSTVEDVLYITGGRQRPRISGEWQAYGEAVVLRLDAETGNVETFINHVSPPDTCADGTPSIVFKCASRYRGRLVLCTETEVLNVDVANRRTSKYLSLSIFNDVHHAVMIDDDRYLVVNTGLDMLVEVGTDGTIHREWSVVGDDPWQRFDRDIDYRKIPSTKPHRAHPNYVFINDGDVWVTRFVQRDAICLTAPTRRIRLGFAGPHDGTVSEGAAYFTSVDGRIIEVDMSSRRVRHVLDLNKLAENSAPLGWCRGLCTIDGVAWVGFSRLRPTRLRANLGWLKRRVVTGPEPMRPTRLAAYDLRHRRLLEEIDLEPYGLNAVFSIVRFD